MLNIFCRKRYIIIPLISLLLIVALFACTQKSDGMVMQSRNNANHDNCLLSANRLSEISSYIAVKMDNLKELSLKRADSGRIRTTYSKGFFLGLYSLIILLLIDFLICLLFNLYRVIRSNRLIIISYIHNLDGMKP